MVLIFPWTFVVGDNHRLMARQRGRGLVMAPRYRKAKRDLAQLAALQWGGQAALKGDLRLTASCWFPDRRRRDVANYAKATQDALTGICFVDDSQLADVRWIRAGIDKDNARIEIQLEAAA